MLSRFRAAGLWWPTVMTLVSLAVLVSVGNWQMQRKAWKDSLVAQISERVAAAPVDLATVMGLVTASHAEGVAKAVEYKRLRVTGRFLHDREQYVYAPHPKLGPGFHVLTPFEVAGADAAPILIVNRGYVSDAVKDRAKRSAGLVTTETTVTGLVRLQGEKGGFTPDNEPARNLWYWRDIQALGAAMVPAKNRRILPFVLDAAADPQNPGGWPKGGVTEVKLPNRHLEYALTWYGLAAGLIAVYGVYAFGRLRARTDF